jgi:enediyne biosynthesis thioesterase
MRAYEYLHVVSFEDTNVVGNVYFTRYVGWQGRCRELFLRDHAPEVLDELARDLRLVTTRVTCEYFAELRAFDEVLVRMTLRAASQTRVSMAFEYLRRDGAGEELVARGEQEAACLQVQPGGLVPAPLPPTLRHALEAYATSA